MIRFCTLYSSSSGNSIFVSDGDTNILIDAGVSASKIVTALDKIGVSPKEIDGILVTHEHTDHISALGVFTRKYGTNVYVNDKTYRAMEKLSCAPSANCVRIIVPGETFTLRSAEIRSFKTPHDSVSSVGYTVTMEGIKMGVATDTGCVTKPMLSALAGCKAVVIEANHDVKMLQNGPYPYMLKERILSDSGHLSNENCGWLATQLALWGTKHIALGHLSDKNNAPDKAYEATYKMLSENGFKVNEDVILSVAMKNEITEIL